MPCRPPGALLLQKNFQDIEESLLLSTLHRPLQISSQEAAKLLSIDLFATVNYDMANINTAASSSERWCEAMLLLSNS